MSPSNQNISYNQQQRTGGLQRLTADLAGLQFNDAEALFKNLSQRAGGAGSGGAGVPAGPRAAAAAAAAAQIYKSPVACPRGRQSPTHQADHEPNAKEPTTSQPQQQQQQQTAAATGANGYDEQMIITGGGGSQFSDHDPVKDAQETADDQALLKRYKLIQLVGTGNYARVYKALTHNGRELAIKAINLSKTSDNYKQKFLPRELAIIKRISHSNICKTHEINHHGDRVFIIMQFCTNGTIADLLHRIGPFSEAVARHLFAPIIDAVTYLHSIEFAHRDLKVENILLDSDYNPKLTDFSYSINTNPITTLNLDIRHTALLPSKNSRSNHSLKHGGGGSHPSLSIKHQQQASASLPSRGGGGGGVGTIKLNETFCGTLPYLSPEMIRQCQYDAKKTDVWSLGICLYVMLNDRLPFPFNDVRLMIKKQMTRDFKFKHNLEFSEQVRDLMSLILEPDFNRRPNVGDLNRHPWFSGPRERPT